MAANLLQNWKSFLQGDIPESEDHKHIMAVLNSESSEKKYVTMPYVYEDGQLMSSEKKQWTLEAANAVRERWKLIEEALKGCKITQDSDELQVAILKYNQGRNWILHTLFNFSRDQTQVFQEVAPLIIMLALDLPGLVPKPVPLLKQGVESELTLSKRQIASILANAFLCTFPERGQKLPTINFDRMLQYDNKRKQEKLKCIFNYFRRVADQFSEDLVTFKRLVVGEEMMPEFWESDKQLCNLDVSSTTSIEETGENTLQVDFANKLIGGGVLNSGLVQEEIRMMTNPELIVARLFTEELQDNEALLMIGSECYNKFSGYSDSFSYQGNYIESRPPDEDTQKTGNDEETEKAKQTNSEENSQLAKDDRMKLAEGTKTAQDEPTETKVVKQTAQSDQTKPLEDTNTVQVQATPSLSEGGGVDRKCVVVAIDATRFKRSEFGRQFEPAAILRETRKAYVGFLAGGLYPTAPVATGNWGCGAFNGDPRLKALLQIMAATEADRSLIYSTFGDDLLAEDIKAMHKMLVEKRVTVGKLYQKISACESSRTKTLYQMLQAKFNCLEKTEAANPDKNRTKSRNLQLEGNTEKGITPKFDSSSVTSSSPGSCKVDVTMAATPVTEVGTSLEGKGNPGAGEILSQDNEEVSVDGTNGVDINPRSMDTSVNEDQEDAETGNVDIGIDVVKDL